MSARPAVTLALSAIILSVCLTVASAATLEVPGTYGTIQAAISAATAGDEVVVATGTYHERINFSGKAITVRSTAPTDPAVVAATIINGDAGGSVVTFNHSETAAATLSGFTITSGKADGGGILCSSASPTITRNVLSGNTTSANGHGGAIFCNAGAATISANTITGNSSANGAGVCLYGGTSTVSGNLIRSNTGSGIYCSYSASTITGNLITGNTGGTLGGGILMIGGSDSIINNTIHGNSAGTGGNVYIYGGSPALRNCLITSAVSGGGVALLSGAAPTIRYCDVYNNGGGNYPGSSDPVGTNGNISVDPRYADLTNFRLQSSVGRWNGTAWVKDGADSPCIDAGDPASAYAAEAYPHGYRINLGYDGNTAYASMTLVHIYIVQTDHSYQTIQAAINAATTGQTVVINPGTYHERLDYLGKAIAVRSSKPWDPPTVAGTIITGDAGGSAVTFKTKETSGASLCGLTITGGSGTGGGVYIYNASPSVSLCTVSGNAGGGVYCSGGAASISGNTVSGNSGGGVCLVANTVATVSGNSISGNSGSGVYCNGCNAVVRGNTITGNSGNGSSGATKGGGVSCFSGTPHLVNNTVSANGANYGGGVYMYGGTPEILNNIIVSASGGGGVYVDQYTYPTIKYNDVFDNEGGEYVNSVNHTGSQGNISKDPLFVDGFRLQSTGGHWNGQQWVKDALDSPCLDAGDPASQYSAEPFHNGGRINMGYDGNSGTASKSPIPSVTRFLPRGEGIPTTTAITLRFSVAMRRGTVQSSLYLNGAKAPEGTFTWTGLKMSYKPKTPLAPNKRYQVKLKVSARSRVEVPLEKEKVWCFTTGAGPSGAVTVAAAPAPTGAAVTLRLTAAADVSVTVRNLAGRVVATLPSEPLPAGVHTRLWNGRSALGPRVPSGCYVVEAVARTQDGTQRRALAPLWLERSRR